MLTIEEALKLIEQHDKQIKKLTRKLSNNYAAPKENSCLKSMNLQIPIFKILSSTPQSPVELLKTLKKYDQKPTRPDLHKTLKQLIAEGYLTKTVPLKKGMVKYYLTDKGKTVYTFLT